MPNQSLKWAHPLIQEWFTREIGSPSEPQKQGWPSILAGRSTLISAPTGSGKTFAAFLTCINQLVTQASVGQLADQTEVLYISPLKALSNDIQHNLSHPLAQITALANNKNQSLQDIRVTVRTGDTPNKDRQKMLKKPPHILVTTPESLYILLTAEKSRLMLSQVKTVIVDEIHAMANDKRGSHLALSLERLEALCQRSLLRIGLSATQKPIERVARFLVGHRRSLPAIVNIGHAKQLSLEIEVPKEHELGPVASNEMWDEIYDRIAALTNENRSTLVFVNTRRLAERIAHHLAERLGEDQVAAHHGSLSKKIRHEAEAKLKHGELKALVATASLELGIDIGSIDLVCQIGSPRSIATALQRIGRAGHWHGAISKGKLFVTTRDELLECASLVHAIKEGDLDQLIIPSEPIDILAQQIIATCATGDWAEEDLFKLIKQAYPYSHLTKETFNTVIDMLANGIAGSRGRYGAFLSRDRVNGVVRARRGARLTAITNGGAIPETGLFTVIAEPNGTMVGTLDEDFAIESNRGDIILLGTTSWLIKRVESAKGRVLVEDAHGSPPSVPFWRGEAPARTIELSERVSQLRQTLSDKLKNEKIADIHSWLKHHCGLDQAGSEQLLNYIKEGIAVLGAVPTQHTIIAERFFDEGGGMQLIIHAPFGARINKAWGFALRKRFCRSFNFELQAAATDDGINIALAEQHSFPLADVFHFLHPNTLKHVLIQAVLQSPLFKTRWRWDATRALALLRFRNGKKIPPNITRMLSDDLLAAVFPDAAACQDNLGGKDIELPDHPLINETMKDTLTEALDVDGLMKVINDIVTGKINCIAIDTPTPSPFSHEILNANPYAFLDDAPLEERRARAVEMRRVLPENVLKEVGKLDQHALQEVKLQSWPDVRNAEELHDVLQTFIALPEEKGMDWYSYLQALIEQGRATIALVSDKKFWVSAEKTKSFLSIFPHATFNHVLKEIEEKKPEKEEALLAMLRGWLLHLGPTTTHFCHQLFNIPLTELEPIFLRLETTGFILRGHFTDNYNAIEWCERRLLAKIHHLTLGQLRKEIEPVSAAQYVNWLSDWQHISAGNQLRGEHGLLEIIRQLQGFEIPANAWEKQIFAKRIIDYQPDMLDKLCLTGVVGWGRLSQPTSDGTKRRMPNAVAPITFFIRDECEWLPHPTLEKKGEGLNHVAEKIYTFLQHKGASFFSDIVRSVSHLKSEVELGLWTLVSAGLITADGFDNLRALIDPRRRLGHKGERMRPRYSSGRWSLLQLNHEIEKTKHLEAICFLLLKRYGVVYRDLLAREKWIPPWRELLQTLRRLEDKGEIRGGRFVDGFLGEQFALPYAVESLRAFKRRKNQHPTITIAASDPLNLVGVILPGSRVSTLSNKPVTLYPAV